MILSTFFSGLPGRVPQGQQPPGHLGLRLIQALEIAGLHPRHRLLDDDAPGQQPVQGGLQGVRVAVDQLGGGKKQLVPGQEHMAVVQIVGQLICKGGLHPAGAVAVEAHAQGDLVHGGKGHAVGLSREKIGVLLQPGQGLGPVGPVQLHGQRHRQLIPGQKFHHPLQPRQLPEGGGQLHGLLGGDALDGLQPLRLLLDNGQGVRPEAVHQPLGGGGADALENAGGQIGRDVLPRLRHAALHGFRRELGGRSWGGWSTRR